MRSLATIALIVWITGNAAPPPDFFLEHDWYFVEFVLFEYPDEFAGRNPNEELLFFEVPIDLRSDVLVLDLPLASSPAKIAGIDESLTSAAIPSHPWFFNRNLLPSISRLQEDYLNVTELAGFAQRREINLLLRQIYPQWLVPDWLDDALMWKHIFQLLHAPLYESETLVTGLFRPPITFDLETEEQEETIGQLIEKEFKAYESDLLQTEGIWTSTDFSLKAEADRIDRSSWHVIHHGRFHTSIKGGPVGRRFFLQAGKLNEKGMYTYEMLFNVSKRLYKHVDVQIWRTLPQELIGSFEPRKYPQRGLPPVYTLNEKRRIVGKKPHFFDHPAFGLIVVIGDLPLPQYLLDLLEASDNVGKPIE